jgi:hypothetical protein
MVSYRMVTWITYMGMSIKADMNEWSYNFTPLLRRQDVGFKHMKNLR